MDESKIAALRDMATQLRIDSVASTSKAGSGHPTSCCSIAEIMATLFFEVMHYDPSDPRNPNNDRFVLSKGHAAPILYAAWAHAGRFPADELVRLRELDCDLEGHPTPRLSFVDVATGSLGQGLSAGCGMAYAGKYLDQGPYRVYVVLGDGESAEGSVWEAISFASHYRLDNLIAVLDVNRLGQSDPTMLQHDVETYRRRLDAFGWRALIVDGHDVGALCQAFEQAAPDGKPTAIVARTFKGKDLPGIEDAEHWHGKALGDKTESALAHLRSLLVGAPPPKPAPPSGTLRAPSRSTIAVPSPVYGKGERLATRAAYGTALARLGKLDSRIVALDGDTKNSTFAERFKAACPERYIEAYIAEQNLVGVGVGLASRGKIPFVSTFACFLSRAFDQIRMAGISRTNLKLVGSHVGVSIGEDGPSQMGLEDLAMFRAVPGCVVFYPSDAVATDRAVELAAKTAGMAYIRTSRPATPVIYDAATRFAIGKAQVARTGAKDQVTVIGAGVTLFEALEAADRLAREGISVRVVDPFTVKPLDRATIVACVQATGGRVIVVEDHYPEGGLGEAVAAALADVPGITLHRLAVSDIPRSGKPQELLHRFGIDADRIVAAVGSILSAHGQRAKHAGKVDTHIAKRTKIHQPSAAKARARKPATIAKRVVRRPIGKSTKKPKRKRR